MKIKNNTITFDKKDTILYDYPFISDGHMLIDLSKIFCFKFKFPTTECLVAFTNKERFSYHYGKLEKGEDCFRPDYESMFKTYDINQVREAEVTPLKWDDCRLVMTKAGQLKAWIDDNMRELLQGGVHIKSGCDPVYNLIGGEVCLIVMPMRVMREENESAFFKAINNYQE